MTIRLRLTLLLTAITLVLLTAGGFLFVKRLNLDLEHGLNANLSARADVISSELRGNGSNLDVPPRLGSASGIYAQLLTADGAVLDSSRILGGTPLIRPDQAAVAAHRTLTLDSTVTLHIPGDTGSEQMRILATPSRDQGVVVAVAISRDVVDKAGAHVTNQLFGTAAIVLLLVGAGTWWLTRAALRPVERMRRQVAAMNGEQEEAGVPVPKTRDEIARLAETFNGLLARLHAALSRERAFVADAGHELRTPLAILKGELELAHYPGRTREEQDETIEVATQETDRLVRLTESLLLLASAAEPSAHRASQHVDLTDLARVVIRAIEPLATDFGTELVLATSDLVETTGDPDQIRRAIENLLTNALRHSPRGTTVTVSLGSDQRHAWLSVADDGPGFPPQFLPIAFDRFTRPDAARVRPSDDGTNTNGNGLGLAIVRSVMTTHGGTATAANRPDGGAQVTLRFPAPAPQPSSAGSKATI